MRFHSVEELEQHWKTDCEAFFLACPDCNAETKATGHDCIKVQRDLIKDLDAILEIQEEDYIELKKGDKKEDPSTWGLDAVRYMYLKKLYDDIYQHLNEKDQQEFKESILEAQDDGLKEDQM